MRNSGSLCLNKTEFLAMLKRFVGDERFERMGEITNVESGPGLEDDFLVIYHEERDIDPEKQ